MKPNEIVEDFTKQRDAALEEIKKLEELLIHSLKAGDTAHSLDKFKKKDANLGAWSM